MLCKKRKRERREATVRKKERKEKTNSKKQIKRTTPFSALCFPVSRPLCLFLCFCSASDLTATLSKRTKRRIRRRKGVKHRSKLSLSFKSIRHAFSMPPTTMLRRLPFPAAQARPCLVRGKPVTRPRHVARAAPANGGSSSSVADRQEQAAPATERPSPASSPPPSPPPPPREPERPEASASSSASPSSPPSPSASSQQAVSCNKALEAERPWRRCVDEKERERGEGDKQSLPRASSLSDKKTPQLQKNSHTGASAGPFLPCRSRSSRPTQTCLPTGG